MQPLRHADYLEWLGLETYGELEPAVTARLERHLESCAECRATRAALARAAAQIEAEQVAVRPGFADEVAATLPPAVWETRRPSGWSWAGTLLVLLLAGAAGLVAVLPGLTPTTAATTVLDPVVAALRDRAALALGSWRGLEMALERLTGGSAVGMAALAAAVLALDLLLVGLCLAGRRRRTRGRT